MSAVDPRTPVLVGAGQVTRRPTGPEDLNDPVSLMSEAAQEAATGSGAPGLLVRLDSLRAVESLGWKSANPPAAVAAALGLEPRDLVATATGGNGPLSLLHDTCLAIGRGDLDVALLVGAEALYSRRVARSHDVRAPEPATPEGSPPRILGDPRSGIHPAELEAGLALPAHVYPLFSNALARYAGGLAEQRKREARLYAGFSDVASSNPYAWSQQSVAADEISEPTGDNRMIAFPYTKRCCANIQVDQGAAVIVTSAAAAEAAGVARDRWVFPWAGSEAHDHWFVSEREKLHTSPAVGACWSTLCDLSARGADDVRHVDLYSCFPSAVLIAAAEIGLDPEDASRPLTSTGGLSFAGGPGNNYSMHSLATVVGRLREEPGLGLVTGVGWFMTKHALSLLGSEPPTGGFQFGSAQSAVDAQARRSVRDTRPAGGAVETFTVVYDREGEPEKAIASVVDSDGSRGWVASSDRHLINALLSDQQVALP